MASLPAEIVTAVALFAGTNVDDVVVLSLLTASSRADGRPRRWEIWAGQYAGFAVLVGLSLAAGRGLALVPEHWLWLLALIPFAVGIVSLAAAIRAVRRGEPPRPPPAGGLPGVAALTIVNGADNLAAYTPFFAATGWDQVAITLAVFAVGVAVWCVAGALLTRHAWVTAAISRYSHWILPAAFILIGLYVLHETNAPIHL
ncbi:MAG TPA: cadmium resistance transporter [Trebonia sp.]|jgi:cadmium resistance protein CadD (predicted permease)